MQSSGRPKANLQGDSVDLKEVDNYAHLGHNLQQKLLAEGLPGVNYLATSISTKRKTRNTMSDSSKTIALKADKQMRNEVTNEGRGKHVAGDREDDGAEDARNVFP